MNILECKQSGAVSLYPSGNKRDKHIRSMGVAPSGALDPHMVAEPV